MFQVRNPKTTERRSTPRQLVVYRLDVTSPNGCGGCLMDISTTGMRVRFKQAVDVSQLDGLRIELPRWLELGQALETRGRFVWVRAVSDGGVEAGFAFDGLAHKESSLLEVLIQRLAEAISEDQPPRA